MFILVPSQRLVICIVSCDIDDISRFTRSFARKLIFFKLMGTTYVRCRKVSVGCAEQTEALDLCANDCLVYVCVCFHHVALDCLLACLMGKNIEWMISVRCMRKLDWALLSVVWTGRRAGGQVGSPSPSPSPSPSLGLGLSLGLSLSFLPS